MAWRGLGVPSCGQECSEARGLPFPEPDPSSSKCLFNFSSFCRQTSWGSERFPETSCPRSHRTSQNQSGPDTPYLLIPQLFGSPATSLSLEATRLHSQPDLLLTGAPAIQTGIRGLKETRATLDPLEVQAEWATQDPLVPWAPGLPGLKGTKGPRKHQGPAGQPSRSRETEPPDERQRGQFSERSSPNCGERVPEQHGQVPLLCPRLLLFHLPGGVPSGTSACPSGPLGGTRSSPWASVTSTARTSAGGVWEHGTASPAGRPGLD